MKICIKNNISSHIFIFHKAANFKNTSTSKFNFLSTGINTCVEILELAARDTPGLFEAEAP